PHQHLHSFPTRRSSDLAERESPPCVRRHQRPAERARDGGLELRRALLLQRVALDEERDEIRERADLLLDPLRALALDGRGAGEPDRKSTRLNSSHVAIS